MNEKKETMLSTIYNKPQLYLLVVLRVIIGYHFLYEGMDKLVTPDWTASGFLLQSNWVFSGLFSSIAESSLLLTVTNFLNIWGQIFIGLGLILGIGNRIPAISGAVLLLLYYIAFPPFVSNYLFIDRNLLELFALLILAFFQTSNIIGLDGLVNKYRMARSD